MAHAAHARLNAMSAAPPASAPVREETRRAGLSGIHIAIHEDLAGLEADWRAFERVADGTVFQTFGFLAAWERHVGRLTGVRPVIVAGRDAGGALLFLLPLALRETRAARVLEWLGADLCDYNAPLLAPGFSVPFAGLWEEIARRLKAHPHLRYDLVKLTKMPERIGERPNPMLGLGVTAHPSGAYLTRLEAPWDRFYAAKRSSATRRRDRTKRKRLSELGEVRFVNAVDEADILAALDTLMAQKARAFGRMGVGNLFDNPGYREFYRALATDARTKEIAHVSRLDVGAVPAAVNLGLIHRGCYYHMLASYGDGDAARFGPGAAHLHDLMRHAIDHGCNVFDFTVGDEPYKRDWCDTELMLYDRIAAASPRGALVAAPMRAGQRFKRWIKQTPWAWNLASKTRAWLGALRRR
jgi:CelD/BcsL family acetyltransferase involved in cellulose biosynthesis